MFTTYNNSCIPIELAILRKKLMARKVVALYPMRSTELALEAYLLKTYKLSLKAACLLILQNCKFVKIDSTEYYVVFLNKKIEQLARLITFGNGPLLGSNILKTALT